MTQRLQQVYDNIPYIDEPIRATSLTHLATVGKLFGLQAVDPNKARILELGCARGGNIISLGYQFPKSSFLGIDLSTNQIESGIEMIKAAAIENVELKQANILDIDASWGEFDYIIAHGVLSWVPENVANKIFNIFSTNLSKNGIGYVSYNSYPGWHIRESLREYMLIEARQHSKPLEQAKAAREILGLLQKFLEGDDSPSAQVYLQEIQQMIRMPDWYFVHDFISEYNNPFYFLDIIGKASHQKLQYLGDSELASMVLSNVRPSLQGTLRKAAPDLVRLEHFLDFTQNRMFRRTLFCHEDRKLQRPVSPRSLFDSYISTPIKSDSNAFGEKMLFKHPNGGAIETSEEPVQRFLKAVSEQWPLPCQFSSINSQIGVDDRGPRAVAVAEQILRCVFANLVEISFFPARHFNTFPEFPLASRLARAQASKGVSLSNLRHESVSIDLIDVELLKRLDGTIPLSSFSESEKSKITEIALLSLLEN